jgi:hypothetical protein
MDGRLLGLWTTMAKPRLRALFPFTTVSAIFERDYFLEHPFDPAVDYGEDLHWAVDAVRAGQKVACTSWARVMHAPPRTERSIRAREERDVALGVEVFGGGYRREHARLARLLGLHRALRWFDRRARTVARSFRGYWRG